MHQIVFVDYFILFVNTKDLQIYNLPVTIFTNFVTHVENIIVNQTNYIIAFDQSLAVY